MSKFNFKTFNWIPKDLKNFQNGENLSKELIKLIEELNTINVGPFHVLIAFSLLDFFESMLTSHGIDFSDTAEGRASRRRLRRLGDYGLQ